MTLPVLRSIKQLRYSLHPKSSHFPCFIMSTEQALELISSVASWSSPTVTKNPKTLSLGIDPAGLGQKQFSRECNLGQAIPKNNLLAQSPQAGTLGLGHI